MRTVSLFSLFPFFRVLEEVLFLYVKCIIYGDDESCKKAETAFSNPESPHSQRNQADYTMIQYQYSEKVATSCNLHNSCDSRQIMSRLVNNDNSKRDEYNNARPHKKRGYYIHFLNHTSHIRNLLMTIIYDFL